MEIPDVAQQPVKLPTLYPIRTKNANYPKAYNFNNQTLNHDITAGNDDNR
jgi:hypothetical protein